MKGDSIMEYLLEEYGDVIICITGLAIAFTFLRDMYEQMRCIRGYTACKSCSTGRCIMKIIVEASAYLVILSFIYV